MNLTSRLSAALGASTLPPLPPFWMAAKLDTENPPEAFCWPWHFAQLALKIGTISLLKLTACARAAPGKAIIANPAARLIGTARISDPPGFQTLQDLLSRRAGAFPRGVSGKETRGGRVGGPRD